MRSSCEEGIDRRRLGIGSRMRVVSDDIIGYEVIIREAAAPW